LTVVRFYLAIPSTLQFLSTVYNQSKEIPTVIANNILEEEVLMFSQAFIDNAKVMAKGQITLPKDIRHILKVSSGDRVTFIVEDNEVRIVNSAIYAMQMLQKEMIGQAQKAGLNTDEDVVALVKELRDEDADQ
jgi:hypothetical protein